MVSDAELFDGGCTPDWVGLVVVVLHQIGLDGEPLSSSKREEYATSLFSQHRVSSNGNVHNNASHYPLLKKMK